MAGGRDGARQSYIHASTQLTGRKTPNIHRKGERERWSLLAHRAPRRTRFTCSLLRTEPRGSNKSAGFLPLLGWITLPVTRTLVAKIA